VPCDDLAGLGWIWRTGEKLKVVPGKTSVALLNPIPVCGSVSVKSINRT